MRPCSSIYSLRSGLSITGNEAPLTLGTSTQLNCSTDLVALMVEWLYSGMVIVQNLADNSLLAIPAVNDSLHNRQYTCRITTPFGMQERNTTISVTGTTQSWSVSIKY